MSSSDEEAVRRPGRRQSPAQNGHDSNPGNGSPPGAGDDQMDENEDADLFGSDGSDGGLDNVEYGVFLSLDPMQCAER